MRILIIEDDAEAGEYLCKGLRESGHSAELVPNGRDGLLQAATGEWDVLIIDRMLPGLDGLSLVRHPGRQGHRSAAARVPAARDPAPASGPGHDPDHAARDGLGLPFRPSDQRDRRAHQPPAPED
jgi:CheY-like chemotaxis protein